MTSTIETEDVEWLFDLLKGGHERSRDAVLQVTLGELRDLATPIERLREENARLRDALERLTGAMPVVVAWGEHAVSDCDCPFCNARAALNQQ